MVNRQAIPFLVAALFFITSNEIELNNFSGYLQLTSQAGYIAI